MGDIVVQQIKPYTHLRINFEAKKIYIIKHSQYFNELRSNMCQIQDSDRVAIR